MELQEFKDLVKRTFGEKMEHATPANVREFLDQLQREVWKKERAEQRARDGRIDAPYEIPSTPGLVTWESLVREFFLQSLDTQPDQAVIMLWVFALDLAYSGIEELHADKLNRLFNDMTGPD
jgi:hypothetical protein